MFHSFSLNCLMFITSMHGDEAADELVSQQLAHDPYAAQVGAIDELKRKWYTAVAECPMGPVSSRCPMCIL